MIIGEPAIGKIWVPYHDRTKHGCYYIFDMRELTHGFTAFDMVRFDRVKIIWAHTVSLRSTGMEVSFEDATDEEIAEATRILLTQ